MNKRLTAFVVALSMIGTPPVRATGIPVIDGANLVQSVTQVVNDVTKISNQAAQITNQINQITNQARMLQDIGPSQFAALSGVLCTQTSEVNTILSTVSQLQYTLRSIQEQINSLYPQGTDWGAFDMTTLGKRRGQWDEAITESASTAMKAQASINRIAARNAQIQSLITQAQSNPGQVRQMQINNQMGGHVVQSMNDLQSVTTTMARSQMLEQQRLVAEREAERENHKRRMKNFTDMGAAVTVHSRLPAISNHR
jgi:type IV secretion system protein VirB5